MSNNADQASSTSSSADKAPSAATAVRHKTHVDMAWRKAEAERMRRWTKDYDVEGDADYRDVDVTSSTAMGGGGQGGDGGSSLPSTASTSISSLSTSKKTPPASANYEVDQSSLLLPSPSICTTTTSSSNSDGAALGQLPHTHTNNHLILDSYPAFTHHHRSLLKKYLTPKVWSNLSHLRTTYGTTIEDVIRPGLALPMGANPPRRMGVLVGDGECYTVFRELLDPIIRDYHGIGDGDFDEWTDPELPMESHFWSRRKGVATAAATATTTSTSALSLSSPLIGRRPSHSTFGGVIKSGGYADDDSDEEEYDEDNTTTTKYKLEDEYDDTQSISTVPVVTTTTATTTNKQQQQRSGGVECRPMSKLRRHPTIINNPRLMVTNRPADPEGKYVISTRIRVARCLEGYKFPPVMSRSERRYIERLVGECVQNLRGPKLANGTYLSVLSMTSEQNFALIQRHILFDNPNEWTIASGLGRDWPDGRAVYANVPDLFAAAATDAATDAAMNEDEIVPPLLAEVGNKDDEDDSNQPTLAIKQQQQQQPDFMIWVNEEDHLRMMCLRPGGDIQGVFETLTTGVREVERELRARGRHFAHDSRLGYLTSCPSNVGTAMRASVHVRLVNLGRLPGFFDLVERLKLEVRGKYGETDRHYTGIFDISNLERLGKSEVHLINVMVEGVAKLIELERKLEVGEEIDIDAIC